MKKQIIIIAAVFVLALAIGIAAIVIANSGEEDITVSTDSFYLLSDEVAELVSDGISGSITLNGYNSKDADMQMLYTFMQSFESASGGRIKAAYIEGGDAEITISISGKTATVAYADVYKRLSSGKAYAFDGEALIADAICELTGKEKTGAALRALSGYDTDGDTVLSTGRPFMYPNISRSDVASLTVTNQYGSYKVYRDIETNSLFFEGAEYVGYDSEMFSQLIVNATYVLANGKVQDPLGFEEYGLTEENATAVLLVVTTEGVSHKIIIGDKTASGSEYYARYVGKEFVYRLPATDLEASLLLPESDFLTALLVYPITETNDIYNIDNVSISFVRDGYTIEATQFELAKISDNAKTYGEIATTDLIVDNKFFSGTYKNWTDGSVFGAFTSTDGEECYVELTLVNYAVDGNYTLKFGVLRDESSNAYLPKSVGIGYTTDGGKSFTRIDDAVKLSQNNQECKTYSASFSSELPVQSIRLYFTTRNGSYVVLDEVRAYADGEDCQPADALVGNWRLTSPSEYIPDGKNFIYPDSSNFASAFLGSIATLVGDKVVETGIASNVYDSSTINQVVLKKYGLDKPDMIASYDFSGWTTTVYFKRSESDSSIYYAYSREVYHGSESDIDMCTGIIASVSLDTAEWLSWDIVDFLDHNLLSMYIDDIDTFTLTFGGKTYEFELLDTDADGKLDTVKIDGNTVNTKDFRYLYVSLIGINLKGEYSPSDETPSEILRVKVKSDTKNPEIIFYRVSATKAYYTVNGQGKYYVLIDKVNTVKNNVLLLIAGETVPK